MLSQMLPRLRRKTPRASARAIEAGICLGQGEAGLADTGLCYFRLIGVLHSNARFPRSLVLQNVSLGC